MDSDPTMVVVLLAQDAALARCNAEMFERLRAFITIAVSRNVQREIANKDSRASKLRIWVLSDLARTGAWLRVLFRGLDGFVHIPNVVPRELVLAARTVPCSVVFGLN